jgi:rod shape determining protein RodA
MNRSTGISALLARINISLALAVAALLVLGSVVVSSATAGMPGLMTRHLVGIAIGLVVMAVAWAFDYTLFERWLVPLMVALVILLLLPKIPGLGDTAKGANSWVRIGHIQLFQPSEPAKLIFIAIMAGVVARYEGAISTWREVGRVGIYAAVPIVLIMSQPDLGTALVFVAITLGVLLVGGLKPRWFVAFAVVATVVVAVVLQPNVHILKQYQRNRLLVFVDNSLDPRNAGYNLEQSKIAIGSGQLVGKGLGSGTQSNLDFLPERHTDFIFSVLGEELGFVGAIVLLGLYLFLLSSALAISTSSKDLFGALLAIGVMSMWLFQILENMGMTIGIMPITGIPLPYMSYGGSFMVTNLAAVGLLMSVWARRVGT